MLYIVGTPIGNIEDISMRALRTLLQCDIILAEDTRTFSLFYQRIQELFSMYSDHEQKIISFHKMNEFSTLSEVIEMLKNGQNIALVSESGMPGISDPGSLLIKHVRMNELPYTVIPGPTAFVTAVLASGIQFTEIVFVGFLEKKQSVLTKKLKELSSLYKSSKTLIVCYESPHRIIATLQLIQSICKPHELVVCRELTKKFEQVISITSETDFNTLHLKGEMVILFRLS